MGLLDNTNNLNLKVGSVTKAVETSESGDILVTTQLGENYTVMAFTINLSSYNSDISFSVLGYTELGEKPCNIYDEDGKIYSSLKPTDIKEYYDGSSAVSQNRKTFFADIFGLKSVRIRFNNPEKTNNTVKVAYSFISTNPFINKGACQLLLKSVFTPDGTTKSFGGTASTFIRQLHPTFKYLFPVIVYKTTETGSNKNVDVSIAMSFTLPIDYYSYHRLSPETFDTKTNSTTNWREVHGQGLITQVTFNNAPSEGEYVALYLFGIR